MEVFSLFQWALSWTFKGHFRELANLITYHIYKTDNYSFCRAKNFTVFSIRILKFSVPSTGAEIVAHTSFYLLLLLFLKIKIT